MNETIPKREIDDLCADCRAPIKKTQKFVCETWFDVSNQCEACAQAEEIQRQGKLAKKSAPEPWRLKWEQLTPKEFRLLNPNLLPDITAHRTALSWLPWNDKKSSMAMVGQTGAGKTWTLYACVQNILKFHPEWSVEKFDCISFGEESKARRFQGKGNEWFRYLTRVDLVVFDDLFRGVLDRQVQEELFALISRRTEEGKPILATSQFTFSALADAEIFEPHIVDALSRRMSEFFCLIPFNKKPKK